MIIFKSRKKSPGYDEAGQVKLLKFLESKGAIPEGEDDYDGIVEVQYDTSDLQIPLYKLEEMINKKFPQLASVEFDDATEDANDDSVSEGWMEPDILTIQYNKDEKKGVPDV